MSPTPEGLAIVRRYPFDDFSDVLWETLATVSRLELRHSLTPLHLLACLTSPGARYTCRGSRSAKVRQACRC
jgi:hypothetical protein